MFQFAADFQRKRLICGCMPRKFLASSVFALSLSACISAPDAPDRPVFEPASDTFSNADEVTIAPEAVASSWWSAFDDPMLGTLVEKALETNKDLSVAAANIAAARSTLSRQQLERGSSTSSTASADLGRAAREDADIEISGSGQLGASWEYDAFGRIAAQIESAARQVERLEEVRRDVAVTVAAETALAYVDYRGNQVRLSVARSNADLQRDSVDLLKVLFDNGRATRLDVERAEAQYRTTLASLPLLELNIRTAQIRLVTLTGQTDFRENESLALSDDAAPSIPSPPQILYAGTPESLIQRRPDIRALEADIARLLALGEVERARLFPTLTFSADLLALFTEDNVSGESFGFGIGPGIRWDGPDLRRVRADIDIADAQTRAAFATYEQAVVVALGEVETALVTYQLEQSRRGDLEAAAAAAARALDLAKLRFDEGLDDFLDVIDAQRTLLDAQDRLESNRLDTTRQAIAAYRALGGIWRDEDFAAARSESE